MEVTVERPEAWKVSLTVKSDSSPLEEEIDKLYAAYASASELPGFRKGKAPKELVRARYKQAVESEAIEKTIPEVYKKAIEQEGINPITRAEIDDVNFEPGKEFSFRATFEVIPEFEVKDYDGLPVSAEEAPPSREQVSERLKLLREMNSSLVPVSREARTGDQVVVDYTVLDGSGNVMPDARVTNYSLPLGEIGQKELDEGLLGAVAGDVKEVMVTFPREAKDKRIAGKRLPVRMKIREVKEKKVPELSDDFARDLGADDLKRLESKVAEDLAAEAKRRVRAALEKEVMDRLIERNSFDPPRSMVEGYIEELRLENRDLATWFARRAILLDKLVDVLEIVVLESEIDERVKRIAEELKTDPKKMRDNLELTGRIDRLKGSMSREKALEYLVKHAKKR